MLGIGVLIASIAAFWYLADANVLTPATISTRIEAWGVWGPLAVVALMTLAVVVTPIPIALASGALYGHIWGALYVVIGAELGAILAFAIAR